MTTVQTRLACLRNDTDDDTCRFYDRYVSDGLFLIAHNKAPTPNPTSFNNTIPITRMHPISNKETEDYEILYFREITV